VGAVGDLDGLIRSGEHQNAGRWWVDHVCRGHLAWAVGRRDQPFCRHNRQDRVTLRVCARDAQARPLGGGEPRAEAAVIQIHSYDLGGVPRDVATTCWDWGPGAAYL